MWDRCHCHERDDSTGVGWILFAMVCFAVAAVAFSIVLIAAHLWLVAQIGLRLLDKQWFRAGWWTCVLLVLFYVDGTVLMSLDLS
jgi:multisubunit Na+/H+ antiporter MnhG subunit